MGPLATGWILTRLFYGETLGIAAAVHRLLTDLGRSKLEWREAAQLLLVFIGVPSAFLLWLFRDINVSGTLENQRKDVNLKEFQEIQMRAAGAMDERIPERARETLQIAALHQIRAFLRGEYGPSFRRPALELLRARLGASADVTGLRDIEVWLREWRNRSRTTQTASPASIETLKSHSMEVRFGRRPSIIAKAEKEVVEEEWEAIFRSGLPLSGFPASAISLLHGQLLAELDLIGIKFIGALLRRVHFENSHMFGADFAYADIAYCHFERATLVHSYFEGAQISDSHFERADLASASFRGAVARRSDFTHADFSEAMLEGAGLSFAILAGANLTDANLMGADLRFANMTATVLTKARLEGADLGFVDAATVGDCAGATFDQSTRFHTGLFPSEKFAWETLTVEQQEAARQPWIARGAELR